MRIAIIGSGIAGLATTWLLSRNHEVVLYEANEYFGGHTHTHDIELDGRNYAVDTGFIVFNETNYPLLSRLFHEIGVPSQPTTMGFSVRNDVSGLEYSATSLDTLFCQRRNLASPRFLRMVSDLLRFYREAPKLLEQSGDGPTLGEYLEQHRYSTGFRDDHLLPMASALWSSPSTRILEFPVHYLVRFMAHHRMLQIRGRPPWRVVTGGSQSYVRALRRRWRVEERLACPVRSISRSADTVWIDSDAGREGYDQVVLACHSDDALALLADASERERDILGAIQWQDNDIVLHTDAGLLPRRPKAWSAWNALVARDAGEHCTVSYCMNILQSLDAPQPLVVTLNRSRHIDPAKVLRRVRYRHPIYTHAAVATHARKREIQGTNRTWFAGAYWGWGFHEDGMQSALDVVNGLGEKWP